MKVFEEKLSGKLAVGDRPTRTAALGYLRPGDMLTVREVDRLGRNLLEGLLVLNDLFTQGIAVKVLNGIAAGEHTERSLILDLDLDLALALALALAEGRRRDIVRKTINGLEAARTRGRIGGRPSVVDPDKRRIVLARHDDGESIRAIAIATAVKVSIGTPSTRCSSKTGAHRLSETRRGSPYWTTSKNPSSPRVTWIATAVRDTFSPGCDSGGLRISVANVEGRIA